MPPAPSAAMPSGLPPDVVVMIASTPRLRLKRRTASPSKSGAKSLPPLTSRSKPRPMPRIVVEVAAPVPSSATEPIRLSPHPSSGVVKYIFPLPPATIPTGPHAVGVGIAWMAGDAAVASNQYRWSLPVPETQIRPPGPAATEVGSAPTGKRPRTDPPGVMRTTVPLPASVIQKLPSAASAIPFVNEARPPRSWNTAAPAALGISRSRARAARAARMGMRATLTGGSAPR